MTVAVRCATALLLVAALVGGEQALHPLEQRRVLCAHSLQEGGALLAGQVERVQEELLGPSGFVRSHALVRSVLRRSV